MADLTRDSYDRVAKAYADRLLGELDDKPLDRALLAALVELAPPGPIADLGCGPGQIARHLHDLGRQVIGIDLSPGMIETARRSSPGPEYRLGTMLSLDLDDGSLGGAIAFYSIIHLTAEELPIAFAELRRVLRPDGVALIAFHAGRHVVHAENMWGVPVSLDFRFHPPAVVRRLLEEAALPVDWEVRRQPGPGEVQTERCYLLARRARIALRRTEARSIVELDGKPIGTLGTTRHDGWLSVDDIELAAAHRSRGIGTRLLRRLLADADREGLPVRLEMVRTNPARRLFERLGFGVEGETGERVLMVRPPDPG
jgi:SAM-dependent methyltransferase